MKWLPNLDDLRSSRTARTYPVEIEALVRAIEEAVQELSSFQLESSSENSIRAVRRAGIGLECGVTIRLVTLESGDHTNTLVKFESRSPIGPWGDGHGKRNLSELTTAIDEKLKPDT
jgi:hypothetical protein